MVPGRMHTADTPTYVQKGIRVRPYAKFWRLNGKSGTRRVTIRMRQPWRSTAASIRAIRGLAGPPALDRAAREVPGDEER